MTAAPDTELMIEAICRDVCELPDRTSPEDAPDVLTVTVDELADILRHRIASTRPADSALADDLTKLAIYANHADLGRADRDVIAAIYSRLAEALRQPAPRADDALRIAMFQTQEMLESIVRLHSTNFREVNERIIANRAALAIEEPHRRSKGRLSDV